MKMKDKLIGAGAVLLAFGALGTTAALASTSTPSKPPAVQTSASTKATEPVNAKDTDTLQEGDQTSADVPGQADANEKADTNEKADANETGTESDGPGGHEDPPGQVDSQQTGQN